MNGNQIFFISLAWIDGSYSNSTGWISGGQSMFLASYTDMRIPTNWFDDFQYQENTTGKNSKFSFTMKSSRWVFFAPRKNTQPPAREDIRNI